MSAEEKVERIKLIRKLDAMQQKLNTIYEQDGLTDQVLDLQLEINTIRHQHNIPDTNETIHKQYVQ